MVFTTQAEIIKRNEKRIDELESQLEQIAKEHEWVSVEERLPKRDRAVILYGDDIIETGYCALDTDIFYSDSGDLKHSDVTHWMPLPPPPIKEKV